MEQEWDWNKALPMWDWHRLVLDGYPNWEKPDGETPASVLIQVKKDFDTNSRAIAIETDDWCEGKFYYRDFTDDSLPFVNHGEVYQSRFWFQFKADADEFKKKYGGQS